MTGFERFRRKHLLTQAQIADMLSVTPAAVSKWESGNSAPRKKLLKELASLYGVTIDELLRDDYPENDFVEHQAKGA